MTAKRAVRAGFLAAFATASGAAGAQEWPPELPGTSRGTVTYRSESFLSVPESVRKADASAAPYQLAKSPPTVDLAFHRDLGPDAARRRLWSSWGDLCVAGDGTVYAGIGDHGDDAGGDARCFLYRWFPDRKEMRQVADVNAVAPRRAGQPAWSKMHAKIDEGPDGGIYFSATLNDGNGAGLPKFRWTEELPGGQLYRHDPASGRTEVFAPLPARRCTATSMLDRERNVWWCNLEAGGGNALFGLRLADKKVVFQSADGAITFNRAMALGRDGSVYFNGEGGVWKHDPGSGKTGKTAARFEASPGMRSSTPESRQGALYGTTHGTNQLFRFRPATGEVELLGPTWLAGEYTTVTVLSPDERFLYYLPGAHGQAFRYGTPVLQYEIATGRRKVLAFLAGALEREARYVPGGTYGVKLSADGGTLYVNLNGHAAESVRPAHLKPNGFGLCAFAAIHIPESER
jgi:sugar lactone lactonase YvrE